MKSVFLPALLFAIAPGAQASIDQAPPNFPYQDGEAVFVDFQTAAYHLIYDFAAKTVTVDSEIVFDAPTKGYPIFDLIPDPRNVRLDDRDAEVGTLADPDRASTFRIVRTPVSPGSHRLTLSNTIETNALFRNDGVASAFWMSDLTDRHYLEQYLPTNFEFDQYRISMRVEVLHAAGKPHVLRANGVVTTLAENVFEVEFPAFYTTSSMFYHLSVAGSIPSAKFTVKSIDGRDLPVEVYTPFDLKGYSDEVRRVIAELEADYGPFPHPKVIVYGAGPGGMEYSGATVSSSTAVGHELFHSYNARGVMPAQGNAGWMDEAMSSWRDQKYVLRKSPGARSKMAGHSLWSRITDRDAYTKGAEFVEWMAGRMAAQGKDFKAFLRAYFKANLYHTMTTGQLKTALELYTGFELTADFDRYVYGKTPKDETPSGSVWGFRASTAACHRAEVDFPASVDNPFHPRLSKEELLNLL